MAMNICHRLCCRSRFWAYGVEHHLLPWALTDVDLGDNVLEIGPGYGANLRVLVDKTPRLTAVEIDGQLADRLERHYGDRVRVLNADGTDTGLPAADFSSVVCYKMLHHVPTAALQDTMFGEAFRLLRSGGVFTGTDGVHSTTFRLFHLGDTYNPMPTETLPDRLRAAGFVDVEHALKRGDQRWRAVKP